MLEPTRNVAEFYRVPRQSWHEEDRDPPRHVLHKALLVLAAFAFGGPIIGVIVQVFDWLIGA